jgi:hypothetical protein
VHAYLDSGPHTTIRTEATVKVGASDVKEKAPYLLTLSAPLTTAVGAGGDLRVGSTEEGNF